MRHLVGDPEGTRLYADDMGTNEAFAAAHRAELAKR